MATEQAELAVRRKLFYARFTIPLKPLSESKNQITLTRKDGSRFIARADKPDRAQYKRDIMTLAAQHRPATPITNGVTLSLTFYLPAPSSAPAWKREAAVLPLKKPDVDNLIKPLKDALTRLGYWKDDCYVADYRNIRKRYAWGRAPGVEVEITEVWVPKTKAEWLAGAPGTGLDNGDQ